MKSMRKRFAVESDGENDGGQHEKLRKQGRNENGLGKSDMLLLECKSIILTLQRQNCQLTQDNTRKDEIIQYLTQEKQSLQQQITKYQRMYMKLEQQTQKITQNQQNINQLKMEHMNEVAKLQKQINTLKQTHSRYTSPEGRRAIGKISNGSYSTAIKSNHSDREYVGNQCKTQPKKQLFPFSYQMQSKIFNPEHYDKFNEQESNVKESLMDTNAKESLLNRNEAFRRMDNCIAKVEQTLKMYSNLLCSSDQQQ